MADPATPFGRALTALRLLAVDPQGLGGVHLRARSGPVRDAVMDHVRAHFGDVPRLHPGITDEALFGGLDVSATLSRGAMVQSAGLLSRPGPLILTMAERTPPALAARLALALDTDRARVLIALDEGVEDEGLSSTLQDRLAFSIDLDGVAAAEAMDETKDNSLDAAQDQLASVETPPDLCETLVTLCETLGISGGRAPIFALRAARALAALAGRVKITPEDVEQAAALTLAHRATRLPTPEPETEPEADPPPPDDSTPPGEDDAATLDLPDELLLDAVRALIPDNLLERLAARKARAAKGSGTGAAVRSRQRGRPKPSRKGRLDGTSRIDVLATLRAAAPWQRIRAAARPHHPGLHIRPQDIHLRQYQDRADRLLIFAVDASGSSALNRLAEAKGAVELLLAQAYARRDHVALIAFRGTGAEVLLPPTRSLVQTKRRLAQLPGGGGTPLAAGLQSALQLAQTATRRGMTPTLALLTDGRANVALDGQANRAAAGNDAQRVARQLAHQRVDAVVIDTGRRPEPALRELAVILAGHYLPMPRADAQALSDAVQHTLEA